MSTYIAVVILVQVTLLVTLVWKVVKMSSIEIDEEDWLYRRFADQVRATHFSRRGYAREQERPGSDEIEEIINDMSNAELLRSISEYLVEWRKHIETEKLK